MLSTVLPLASGKRVTVLVTLSSAICAVPLHEWLGCARWSDIGRYPLVVVLLLCSFCAFSDVAGFPAVGDLRQDFPDSFNVFLCPRMHLKITYRDNAWRW